MQFNFKKTFCRINDIKFLALKAPSFIKEELTISGKIQRILRNGKKWDFLDY